MLPKCLLDFVNYSEKEHEKNELEGKKIIEFVGFSGDFYWTNFFIQILENGKYGFQKDHQLAILLKDLSKSQSFCDCSVFDPWSTVEEFFS